MRLNGGSVAWLVFVLACESPSHPAVPVEPGPPVTESKEPDRDVYFSSKGHDVPGLYSALFALGAIPVERLMRLRKLGGLDGHPDVGVPGIEANSGSLGMGISKGRGIAWAKRHLGRGGQVVVMVGDGELQEGQNYEGLQAAAHEGLSGLTVVVEHGNGYYSVYSHLHEASVKLGAEVTKGQAIGTVGGENTDYGPHLHFEIRGENQVALDPTDWLKAR